MSSYSQDINRQRDPNQRGINKLVATSIITGITLAAVLGIAGAIYPIRSRLSETRSRSLVQASIWLYAGTVAASWAYGVSCKPRNRNL